MNNKQIVGIVIILFGASCILIGFLFRVMHWPGSLPPLCVGGVMIIAGIIMSYNAWKSSKK